MSPARSPAAPARISRHPSLPAKPAWDYLELKLRADQTNSVHCTKRFRPHPKDEGLSLGWHRPDLADETDWRDIRIGTAWEAQGYPALDGWAWYRLWVDIPARWQGRPVFLSFEGGRPG